MAAISEIWSDHYLVQIERILWIEVMKVQHSVRPDLVSAEDIVASQAVVDEIDLDRIWDREMETKHDLKARLDEFAFLSGHSHIHLGMTSADVVENTYAIRIKESCGVVGVDPPRSLGGWIMRGIRGPIGSDVDQLELLGSKEAVYDLQEAICARFGFDDTYGAVAQNPPRSYDLAIMIELLLHTGNPVDRMIMVGLQQMMAEQTFWLEGDVSSSCIRRYAWPLAFSVLEGALHIDCQEAPCQN